VADLGIMIEGQEGLNWDRWRLICQDAEDLGFASLRRSDHLVSLQNDPTRDCIDCWTSLALAAEWTSRIEFGSMVTPVTWIQPPVLARQAAAVDILSGGRLLLGLGTGWNANEHEYFQIPFPEPIGKRFKMLEAAIEQIQDTWVKSNPKPVRGGRVPLLIGGRGTRKTLPLAALYASEWNMFSTSPEAYREASEALDERCREVARDPADIRRSVMGTVLVGRTRDEARARAEALKQVHPRLRDATADEILAQVTFGGTVEEVVEKMRPFFEAGAQRVMFQHFLMDDRDHLRVLAEEVAPAIRDW
jgi:alkanesulfonate monooxygenase SsuD/methylene tetrahydromethanopterin reductase-like flavin-dependent oxidoreductase (luciferase family)